MDRFWVKNPKILIEKYKDIFIKDSKNVFNSLSRLFIYTTFIFILFNSYKWAYICLISLLLITFIGYHHDIDEDKINKIKKLKEYNSCKRSTINNPMSNKLVLDNDDLEPCIDEDKDIVDNNLYYNFLEDEVDINAKRRLRSFINIPKKNVNKFLKFVYGDVNANCKYNGIHCEKFRDIRYNR
jgi:hypothetical protein